MFVLVLFFLYRASVYIRVPFIIGILFVGGYSVARSRREHDDRNASEASSKSWNLGTIRQEPRVEHFVHRFAKLIDVRRMRSRVHSAADEREEHGVAPT